MAGTKHRRPKPPPFQRVTPEVAEARGLVAMLTYNARRVMSRLKEPGGVALSLPELASLLDSELPGLVTAPVEGETRMEVRRRLFDPARTTESLVLDDRQRAEFLWRSRQERAVFEEAKKPLEQRFLPDGGLLPALEENPAWLAGMELARAVIVELETLGLLIAVEVRGASVSEKWTATDLGRRVLSQVSVHEWRKPRAESGKSEA